MPRLSVIIPFWNQGLFLQEAVASALQQGEGVEVLVIDNGSDDMASLAVLSELEARSSPSFPVTVLRQSNEGPASARNRGLDRARGEFVQFLDGDDWISPSKSREQIAWLEEHGDADVALSDCVFHEQATGRRYKDEQNRFRASKLDFTEILYGWERGLSIPIHTALFRRRALAAIRFDESLRAKEDWLFWIDVAKAGFRIRFSGGDHAFYRRHSTNMSGSLENMAAAFVEASLLASTRIEDGGEKRRFAKACAEHVEKYYLAHLKGRVADDAAARVQQSREFLVGIDLLTTYRRAPFLRPLLWGVAGLMRLFWKGQRKFLDLGA